MFLLLGGTELGFSFPKHLVAKLPEIYKPSLNRRRIYVINESIEGWADSIKYLMKTYCFGVSNILFDFRDIRPKGSQLITTGGNNLCLGMDAGVAASPSGAISTASNQICLGNNNISALFCADTSISSSDKRDKTDVENFNVGLEWIEKLQPVTYRWDRRTWYGDEENPFGTPDGSKKRDRLHLGFLAQDVLEVEKSFGYAEKRDDMLTVNLTEDGNSYGMKYERLVTVLVNAVKELSAEVKVLQQEINTLKGE